MLSFVKKHLLFYLPFFVHNAYIIYICTSEALLVFYNKEKLLKRVLSTVITYKKH